MRRAVIFVALLSLAGCATIPITGPVLVGGPNTIESQIDVEFLPPGPDDGATQREILDGFISAGSAPQNNFRIARSFLTVEMALTWNPALGTFVRGGSDAARVISATEMTYSTEIESRVDENGVLTVPSQIETVELNFSFSRVDGEWRLSYVPNRTVISESAFSSAYGEYTAYFYNFDRTAFVPDVRVFARQGNPLDSVARAVIEGPSEYLPNASTAFPRGSELVGVLADLELGNVTVDVSDDLAKASIADQQDMLSQLGASLGELPDVNATAISVNRLLLPIAAVPGLEPNRRVDDRPLILSGTSFGYATETGIESTFWNAASIASLKPTSVSFDAPTRAAAIGAPTGVYLLADTLTRLSRRAPLVEPQIDGSQSVWWVEPESPDRISVFADYRDFIVSGSWAESAEIVALEVSRDDARIAIGINDGGLGYVMVGAISVDFGGRPRFVSDYRRLSVSADSIVDLAWADSTHVAVLGNRNGNVYAELATVGGLSRLIGQPQNPMRISGGNEGVEGLVVMSADGQLWRPRGAGWRSTGVSADVLATQH